MVAEVLVVLVFQRRFLTSKSMWPHVIMASEYHFLCDIPAHFLLKKNKIIYRYKEKRFAERTIMKTSEEN